MNGKKIIVTGGAGFIGSALTEQLLQTGCKVVCVDNFSTGRRENIAGFLAHPDYTLIEGDICDTDLMKEACSNADYVLHEAALGSVPRSIANPSASYQANITGTASVFHAAALCGVGMENYAMRPPAALFMATARNCRSGRTGQETPFRLMR